MASMVGLEGSLQLGRSTRLSIGSANSRLTASRAVFTVRAQGNSASDNETVAQSSRRAVLGLVATGIVTGSFVQAVLAEARAIKIGPPPPPSGGLPGTLNSDEARDLVLPLKERFFLQSLPPTEAAQRIKDSAKEIISVKELIDKKAWPYVQNNLRSVASYLRFDIKTVLSSMPKDQKKPLKEVSDKLLDTLGKLDYAARVKSSSAAEKYYAETVSDINNLLAKLG